MKLSEYINVLKEYGVLEHCGDYADCEISAVTCDSRTVRKGSLFCAIRGTNANGEKFIDSAIRQGAAAVVSESDNRYSVPSIKVNNAFYAWALICSAEADFPDRSLELHTVTGTNGKTTTAYMLRSLFREGFREKKCGMISTVEIDTGNGKPVLSEHTTPDAKTFQNLITEMKNSGCSFAVTESSSHGLAQRRSGAARFKTAIFTNLTGDHLDYHKTMEAYYSAKKILFTEMCSGTAIINIDDEYGLRLADELAGGRVIRCSLKDSKAECYAEIVSETIAETVFNVWLEDTEMQITMPLPGKHNVYNALGAIAAAYISGISEEVIKKVFSEFHGAPGRLEKVSLKNGASAFVDFAHTDDALKHALETLRPFCNGRLICVFGCGGNRDTSKRPRMGKAASEIADVIIITNDNPRNENPDEIAKQVAAGILPGAEYSIITDRKTAIIKAAEIAEKDDIILIAGKGHENTQETAGVKRPFSDIEVLRQII